jgi:hypothetical protein
MTSPSKKDDIKIENGSSPGRTRVIRGERAQGRLAGLGTPLWVLLYERAVCVERIRDPVPFFSKLVQTQMWDQSAVWFRRSVW